MNETLSKWSPQVLSVLRFISGFLMLWHGSQKLFAFPPPPPQMAETSQTFLLVAGGLEFVGGLLIMIGLFTRPAAFIMSGMMAVAYFVGHAPQGFLPIVNGGELAVLYCFIYFYLVFAGGGAWSLDRLIWKKD